MRGIFLNLAFMLVAAGVSAQRPAPGGGRNRNNNTQRAQRELEECVTQYIAAIDKECFDETMINRGGVYARCNDRSAPDLFDAMNMQVARIMNERDANNFFRRCQAYRSHALDRWLSGKDVVERSALRSSQACLNSMADLTAAKQCYTAAIAHDGNFFEFDRVMRSACGSRAQVARRFSQAGNMGLSNLPQIIENHATLQFTNKHANWRQSVEVTLVNYIYAAQQACGDGDYDLIVMNEFAPDERENILTLMNRAYAENYAANAGSRGVAFSPLLHLGNTISNPNLLFAGANRPPNAQISWPPASAQNAAAQGSPAAASAVPNLGNVYKIVTPYNVTMVRARLASIILNGDIGSIDSRDDLDVSILVSMGARQNASESDFYNMLSRVSSGSVFVIISGGSCQAVQLASGRLDVLRASDVRSTPQLSGHISGCQTIVE